jgi:hypothetical protein
MAHDDKKLFELDRNGGREKINKATYNPKSSRAGNTEEDGGRKKAGIGTWIIIGCIILMVLAPVLQPVLR